MATVKVQSSRFALLAPENLQPMQALEVISTDAIINARMTRFVEFWNENDPPSAIQYDVAGLEFDPIKVNQECNTYFELMLRDRINQNTRAVTLAFGSGTDLDA